MNALMIHIGTYLFRTRNYIFPLFIIALYVIAPPLSAINGSESLEHIKDAIAIALTILGLAVRAIVIGYAYIKRGGINKQVYAETLVTEGMFTLCRNPLYLGNMLIYSGVFLMHGNPLIIILGICSFFCIYQCIIATEENYLCTKFGDSYSTYCARTPRWLPVLSRFKAATSGMDFKFRRVIAKDYSTMATATIALTLTELYEYMAMPDARHHLVYLGVLSGGIVIAGLATWGISRAKKRGLFAEKSA